MKPVAGNTVKLHYTGKYDDGNVFDTTTDSEPFEFVIGEEQIIKGFEDAVMQMVVGEKKTVTIGAEKAYGLYEDDLVIPVPRAEVPSDIELEVGLMLNMSDEDGNELEFEVIEFDDEKVILDGNHPLAGEDLTFEIELLEIN